MIKLRNNVKLEDLEQFGFENGIFTRVKNGQMIYMVVITSNNRYLQIRNCNASSIGGSLQALIYKLTTNNLLEEEK